MSDALVIGGGPAGLMAAAELARAGRKVLVVDAMPSMGRKFLMAGKSGLNLTKDEPAEAFLAQYGAASGRLAPMLRAFGNTHVPAWAEALGQEVFTGSSGRVFPRAMKASPLLRALLRQLADEGVAFRTRWRWLGWEDEALRFATSQGKELLRPNCTVLALGGASWPRLGSDGAWAALLRARHVPVVPFAPANAGLRVSWTDHMERHLGSPVKNVVLAAGGLRSQGEFVLSRTGLEGGGIYAVSAAVRSGAPLFVDLLPDWSKKRIAERLRQRRGKDTRVNHLRKKLGLSPAKLALLQEFARPLPPGDALAETIKALEIRHDGMCPLEEAISTAGGLSWEGLDENLMLRALPGIFAAGEMLDWEAPTGGYLLTACLSTGRWAGKKAAEWRD